MKEEKSYTQILSSAIGFGSDAKTEQLFLPNDVNECESVAAFFGFVYQYLGSRASSTYQICFTDCAPIVTQAPCAD